jgi:hypothetical protein
MITAGLIFGAADTVCQKFLEPADKRFDYRRVLNMVMIGGLISAPMGHLWYCKWAPSITQKLTTKTKFQPLVSMLADQLLYTPVTLSIFLFSNSYLKDFKSLKAANNIKEKFMSGITTNWKVWPPIVLIGFAMIPPQMRVLYVNVFGFFWSIYLSHLQNN